MFWKPALRCTLLSAKLSARFLWNLGPYQGARLKATRLAKLNLRGAQESRPVEGVITSTLWRRRQRRTRDENRRFTTKVGVLEPSRGQRGRAHPSWILKPSGIASYA